MAFFCYFCSIIIDKTMNRKIFLAFLLAAVLCACRQGKTSRQAEAAALDTLPTLIMQIQKSSRLYTAEYHIHKIVTHEDVLHLKGTFLQQAFKVKLPLGDRKIAIPMDATLKAYIDFSDFSERNIERDGDRINIILPDPKVVLTSSKVDQANIKEYVSLARAYFSDAEMADYEQQGRASILQNILKTDIIDMARENAARILVPMLVQTGFKEENITVTFRKQYDERDLSILIDKTSIEH